MTFVSLLGPPLACLASFQGAMQTEGKLPSSFVLGGIDCRHSEALIAGGQRRELDQGGTRVQRHDALLLRVATNKVRGVEVINLGRGVIVDLSCPGGDIVYAVRDEWTDKIAEDRHTLMRSVDFGSTWDSIEAAPPDLVGVAFYSGDSGYAWSKTSIYHTMDQGKTWKGVPSPNGMMRRSPKPVVDPQGSLWVAINHGPGYERLKNGLVRIMPDLNSEARLQNAVFNVWEMAADRHGNLLMLTEDAETERIVLRTLQAEWRPNAIRGISELPSGLPHYVRSVGSGIVVMIAKSFSEEPKSTVLSSRDSGVSWSSVDIPEPGINCMCAWDIDAIWYVGTSGTIYGP